MKVLWTFMVADNGEDGIHRHAVTNIYKIGFVEQSNDAHCVQYKKAVTFKRSFIC